MLDKKKNERELATSILIDVLEAGAYANIALRRAFVGLSEADAIDPRGRAFVTDLVNETLRNLLLIDQVIGSVSKTPIEKMKPFIRNLLRISVCQIKHMERIPSRAAVNEAVNLTKARGLADLSGFVNGVLRAIDRQKNIVHTDIALKYSYPKWLYSSLIRWLGETEARVFCENSHHPPMVIILTNIHKTTTTNLHNLLEAQGVKCEPLADMEGLSEEWRSRFLTLRQSGDITKLPPFQEGLFFVMDPGAISAIEALSPKPGQTIIDICAAPGGKSFAAACQMQNTGQIHAFDIHPHRVQLINQTRKRLGLSIIKPEEKDALMHDPSLNDSADAVLLDAPCSGLGTIRKHPEIKYTRLPKDITALAQKQYEMLTISAKYVKPGGTLVYCTCTITPEENMDNINQFLKNNENYKLDNARQILPSSASDGFFTAKMVRL